MTQVQLEFLLVYSGDEDNASLSDTDSNLDISSQPPTKSHLASDAFCTAKFTDAEKYQILTDLFILGPDFKFPCGDNGHFFQQIDSIILVSV